MPLIPGLRRRQKDQKCNILGYVVEFEEANLLGYVWPYLKTKTKRKSKSFWQRGPPHPEILNLTGQGVPGRG